MLRKPPRGTLLNKTHPLNRGVVGCWLHNELSGGKTFDLSGNQNHGTLTNGPIWSPSKFGGSIDFDGSTNYISVNSKPEFIFGTNDFAISYWATTTSAATKVAVGKSAGTNAYWIGLASGKTRFSVGSSSITESTATTNDGEWHNVVGSRKSGIIYLYVNGKFVNSTSGNANIDAPSILGIGKFGSSSFHWSGRIDETRIYNRALNASEIKQLSQRPQDLYQQDNLAYLFVPSVAAFFLTATDGYKFSDSLTNSASAIFSLSDGFKYSDQEQETADVIASLIDTFKLSDSASLVSSGAMTLSDGVIWSDTSGANANVTLTLSDGLNYSDAAQIIATTVMGMTDTYIVSDALSMNSGTLVAGPIKFTVQTKQAKINFTIKKPEVSLTTKKPTLNTEI